MKPDLKQAARLFGGKGGFVAARNLTPAQRRTEARKVGLAAAKMRAGNARPAAGKTYTKQRPRSPTPPLAQ